MGARNSQFCKTQSYEALLLDYAAGTLCLPLSSIVAAHLTLSPQSRAQVSEYEKIGGAMLENMCEPVAMDKGCLDKVLQKLGPCGGKSKTEKCTHTEIGGITVPASLKNLKACDQSKRQWKTVAQGFEVLPMKKDFFARYMLIRLQPNAQVPAPQHRGLEITLVLEGAFYDENGRYERGDMIIVDDQTNGAPTADKETGCVCLSVRAVLPRVHGWTGFIIHQFLR